MHFTRRSLCQSVLAGALLTLPLLPGCGNNSGTTENNGGTPVATSAPDTKLKLGFIVKDPDDPWFQAEWKFADEAAKKDGFELLKIPAPDGEKVLSAIDNVAANGAKGFVICTPDTKLGPAIVAKAKSKNLKVIAVDDQFLGADGKPMADVPYLGISAGKIGEDVGKALYAEMQKRKWAPADTAVLAMTWEQLETTRQRTDGAIGALKKAGFPAAQIYKARQKTADNSGGFDAANVAITQHPEVKHWLVCGNNDTAVIGAVRALEGRGFKADSVVGIGINGTGAVEEFKKSSPTGVWGSMQLQPKKHGYDTAEMLYQWVANGKEPPRDTRTIGILITRDNYKKVLAEQGISD